jgi:putative ABC transport system permease protein
MPVLFRLALRNLVAHKAKSLIVGSIIALGVIVLVAGISFMDTAALGLRRSFIENFTGDVMISGKAGAPISLFGVQSMGGTEGTPEIPRYEEVVAHLRAHPGVKGVTPQITGANQINIEGNDFANVDSLVFLFGIDPAGYRAMFDNLDLVSGRYLQPGEQGILLSSSQVASLDKELKTDIKVGDTLIIQNFGTSIRAVTVRGIFQFKRSNAALNMISYIDAASLRALEGMTAPGGPAGPAPGGTAAAAPLPEGTDTSLLGKDANEAELFGGTGNVVKVAPRKTPGAAPAAPRLSSSALAATTPAATAATGPASWQFIVLSLQDPGEAPRFIAETNAWFAANGIDAAAAGWQKAAGPFATIPSLIRILLVAAILIVSVVAVIIIMNTLVGSVIERTSEIGTMRALGAKKGFVWRMFFIETLTISIVFGLIGTLIGAAIVAVLNAASVPAANPILQLLVGGPVIRPVISASALGASIIVFVMIGVIAHLYPVAVALKIPPIRAIRAGQSE